MSDYFENYTEVEFFPKTNNIRGRYLFDKHLLIENIEQRLDTIRSSTDYLTKVRGDIWFTIIFNKDFFFERIKDNKLTDYFEFLKEITTFDINISLPQNIMALVIHINFDKMYLFNNEVNEEKYKKIIKNITNRQTFFLDDW